MSQNDRSTSKWCGLWLPSETVQHRFNCVSFPPRSTGACSHVGDRSAKGGRGRKQCRFLLRFHFTVRSWSFQSLDYWFEGYRIDFMCLVHRLNIFDTTAWGKKLAQWHESSIIVKLISGSPRSWHTNGHTSGGTVQGTDWQIPVMPPTLKVIFLSGFEERMCCSFSCIP